MYLAKEKKRPSVSDMNIMRKIFGRVLIVFAVLILGYAFVEGYSYIFQKRIKGEVVGVERVNVPMTVLATDNSPMNSQIFSFAIALRDDKTNEIFTASAEDRQWAVVQKGQCAEVTIFPYPPWQLKKGGTYFNARLDKLFDCVK